MEHISEEESEVSDSEIDECKENIYAQLQAGKMKVKHGETTFRCPFCPGKKKQDYNVKDLLQHASGIGAARKRKVSVRASHLALAEYVKNDLRSSLEPSLQLAIVEYKPPKDKEEFVWPWMGILVNVPTELNDEKNDQYSLRAQFSRFRPQEVLIIRNSKGLIDHSIIKFDEGFTGFKDALAFQKHFIVEKYGKKEWNETNCRKDDLYGWLAHSDDYNSPGTIGEHLRKNGVLRSMSDLEREGEAARRLNDLALQIEEKNKHLYELELKNNQNAMKLDRLIEETDQLVERHIIKVKNMQRDAIKSSKKVLEDNLRLHEELQAKKVEIDQRCKQLEELAKESSIDRAKVEGEKQKNAKENGLLTLATLKQKKANEELRQLVKKHQLEKDDALRKQSKLQDDLNSRQNLELQIEQLRGKLEVMKHMEAEPDASSKELEKIREKLEAKDEDMEEMEARNQALIIMERRTNDELEEAKKELISGLQQNSGTRATIGVKRMGELDQKAFKAACKEKVSKHDFEANLAILCSKWDAEIRKPEWHPFKVIDVDGQTKEIVLEEDEKLQGLKAELGKEAHDVVVKALVELNEYNPSGRYPVPELWHTKENRKAPINEAAAYMVKRWKDHKKKSKYH